MKNTLRLITTFLFVSLVCACIYIPSLADEGEPAVIIEELSSADIDSVSGSSAATNPDTESNAPENENNAVPATENPQAVVAEDGSAGDSVSGEAVGYTDESIPSAVPEDSFTQVLEADPSASPEPGVNTGTVDEISTVDTAATQVANSSGSNGLAVRMLRENEKTLITAANIILPDVINSGNAYVTVGGILLAAPAVNYEAAGISESVYVNELKGNLKYVLKKDSDQTEVDGGGRANLLPGTYSVGLKLIDETRAVSCKLDAGDDGVMNTGKTLDVSYYVTSTDNLTNETLVGGNTDSSDTKWYRSASIVPRDGYQFIDAEVVSGEYTGRFSVGEKQEYKQVADSDTRRQLFAKTNESGYGYVLGSSASAITVKTLGNYRIDTAKPGATLSFPEYPATGTRFITDKTASTLTLKYALTDETTETSGASKIDSVEYKLTRDGTQSSNLDESVYNNLDDSIVVQSGSERNLKGVVGTKAYSPSLTGFTDGDAIYVYSKITDVAGNVYCFSTLFGFVEYSGPKYSSTNEKINSALKKSDGTLTLLMYSEGTYRIRVQDRTLKKVSVNGEEQTISVADNNKYVDVDITRPAAAENYKSLIRIHAENDSSQSSDLVINVISYQLELVSETIDLGTVTYGDFIPASTSLLTNFIAPEKMNYNTDASTRKQIIGKYSSLFNDRTGQFEKAKEKSSIKSISILSGGEQTSDAITCTSDVSTTAAGYYGSLYIAPKDKLNAGNYSVVVRVEYSLTDAEKVMYGDSPARVVLGEESFLTGRVEKVVTFNVEKAPLALTYGNGTSIRSTFFGSRELKGKRPGAMTDDDPADWTDRLSIVADSLKNGDTAETVRNDENYKKPVITDVVSDPDSALVDGRVMGTGDLYFAISRGDASTNYYYQAAEIADRTVRGWVECVDSSFSKTIGAEKGSYYVRGENAGRKEWYKDDVTIGAEDGYKILDAGTGTCEFDPETGKITITSDNHKAYSSSMTLRDQIVVSREAAACKGVVQYFYQKDVAKDVISDLMYECVFIDKSRPGYAWNSLAGGEVALGTFPYFQWVEHTSQEVFHLAGISAYKDDKLSLFYMEDAESGIESIGYLIIDDDSMTAEKIRTLDGWKQFILSEGNYLLDENEDKTGNIYVKLTNNAGMSTYLSLDDKVEYYVKEKPDRIIMDPVSLPEAEYGYESVNSVAITWKETSTDGTSVTAESISYTPGSGDGEDDFLITGSGKSGQWYIRPRTGLAVGKHGGTITATFSDGKKRTASVSFTVKKRKLTVSYSMSKTTYNCGEKITNDGRLIVTGFVSGEGRMDSADKTVKKAADYEDPKVTIPESARNTTWIVPYGGKARDYSFEYKGFYLNVVQKTPVEGEHYIVKWLPSTTGWSLSRIMIYGYGRYKLSLSADGSNPIDSIELAEPTSNGSITYYVVDPDTGEILGPVVYRYKIDVLPPLIEGVKNGQTVVTNHQYVTVTDDNLDTVTVNGIDQKLDGNRIVLDLHPTSPLEKFLIVATDKAGSQSTRSFSLRQPDGMVEETPAPLPSSSPLPVSTTNPGGGDGGTGTGGGDSGTQGRVIPDIQLLDGAPDAYVCEEDEKIMKLMLTSDEIRAVKNGSDFRYRLVVRDISSEISQSDKEKVFAALGDFTVAQYLSISLWKSVGGGAETQVFKTDGPMAISIEAPDGLPGGPNKYRFGAVRVAPNGTDMLLDSDEVPTELTISTNRFDALYAVAYRKNPKSVKDEDDDSTDDDNTPHNNNDNNNNDNHRRHGTDATVSPEAGDHAPILPTAIAFGFSFIGMITVAALRRRT